MKRSGPLRDAEPERKFRALHVMNPILKPIKDAVEDDERREKLQGRADHSTAIIILTFPRTNMSFHSSIQPFAIIADGGSFDQSISSVPRIMQSIWDTLNK